MKEKLSIKTVNSLFPVLGIVLLLLLSPCKVRHFFQSELGIPQTEVSNKSKITINNYNCGDLEFANHTIVQKNTTSQNSPFLLADFELGYSVSDFSSNYKQHYETRNHSVSPIPLYILYQNFKDYL